jgi:hypothetical protein
MWVAMVSIVLLFFLSIYGAFVGPESAKEFFNSVPLAAYWISFILLLVLGIALFRRLIKIPSLLFMHFGCILILLGGIWGSKPGLKLQSKIFGINKIPSGLMQIYEGETENRVLTEQDDLYILPFSIVLKDFRIEYYKPAFLYLQTRQGDTGKFPVEEGKVCTPDFSFGTIEIVKVFNNFKMTVEGDNRIAVDDPGAGFNPALEVKLTPADGQPLTRYVFDTSHGYMYPNDDFAMVYICDIKDYISHLQVIRDSKVVAEKEIEVNHPLHYGGYHFYQQDYDHEAGEYTILRITSDSGLQFVYAGFIMLCTGVFWHFWINKMSRKGV